MSEWVETEVASALAIKLRTRQIDAAQKTGALERFSEMVLSVFTLVSVMSNHFRIAAQYAGRSDLALRAGDALHLAICADHGATLATLDRRLIDAAPMLGIALEIP